MSDSKRNYRLTFMGLFEVFVEVDHAVLTEEKLREHMNFWTEGESLINGYGTPLKAFLTLLCRRIMKQSVLSLNVKDEFNSGCIEGYPPLDGTHGLTLITYDDFEFDGDVDIDEETDDAIRPGH